MVCQKTLGTLLLLATEDLNRGGNGFPHIDIALLTSAMIAIRWNE